MLAFVLVLVLVLGLNTAVWGTVGLCRLVASQLLGAHRRVRRAGAAHRSEDGLTAADVAVLIAAHDEELVIAGTIGSVLALGIPPEQVFVASDASSDRTAQIAREYGARVLELRPNRGKAGALAAAIAHFRLDEEFPVVMLLDADTRLAPDYLGTGLALFDDPQVVAVAGRAATIADPPAPSRIGRFLIAYRERFYVAIQYLLKYGQASRPANAISIVPGFASMYRGRILPRIDITAPGLAIEDFNMTFEVHAKRLGRIAFHPQAAIAYTQDPDTCRDYARQLHRWTLGFWQTVRRHGFHLGRFWAALALYVFELLSSSVVLLLTVPLLLASLGFSVWEGLSGDRTMSGLVQLVPPLAVVLGVLLPDYLLTVFTAVVTRRPRYLLLGLGFPIVRIVDAAICLRALPEAFLRRSRRDGVWTSPVRRVAEDAQSAEPVGR